jgi:hypothetical protein
VDSLERMQAILHDFDMPRIVVERKDLIRLIAVTEAAQRYAAHQGDKPGIAELERDLLSALLDLKAPE